MKGSVYAYCLVAGAGPELLDGAPLGVPGAAPPRLLPVSESTRLVVSTATPREWSEQAISAGLRDLDWVSERAMRHEEVVAHCVAMLGERAALLPMKAFTLFGSDERALAHVREREDAIGAALDRVAGCVEWGARLRYSEQAARAAREREAKREQVSSGAAFLARKKQIADAARGARAEAIAAATRAVDRLATIARETRRIPPPEGAASALVAEAAYLVPRGAAVELERIAATVKGDLDACGVELELTGPWAPYHFVGAGADR